VEKHVYIGFPDVKDINDILATTLRKLNIGDSDTKLLETLDFIAHHPKSSILTPADISAVVKSAYSTATQEFIDQDDAYSVDSKDDYEINGQCMLKSHHLLSAFHKVKTLYKSCIYYYQ
jgi:SpoVK/Ycf46/Vps4 family AAA+-type ATPase